MNSTIEKIEELAGAISPARIFGRKSKAKKASNAKGAAKAAPTRRSHLATIKKNLAKLAKDIEKLAAMVAGGESTKRKAPAKKSAAKMPARARKPASRAKKTR